ncbi:MAG: hypothetical protein JW727_01365 [Candidatus Aenigmarchaeota archaeon]|nr:hypothetical protein [Candidatus Aenigmarchaeota archaeon]
MSLGCWAAKRGVYVPKYTELCDGGDRPSLCRMTYKTSIYEAITGLRAGEIKNAGGTCSAKHYHGLESHTEALQVHHPLIRGTAAELARGMVSNGGGCCLCETRVPEPWKILPTKDSVSREIVTEIMYSRFPEYYELRGKGLSAEEALIRMGYKQRIVKPLEPLISELKVLDASVRKAVDREMNQQLFSPWS